MRRFSKLLCSCLTLSTLLVVLCACQHDQVASSGWKGPPEAQAIVIENIEAAILARLTMCVGNQRFDTDYVPLVKVAFSRDGTMEGAPTLLNPPKESKDRVVAETALRISRSCDAAQDIKRYQNYYDTWHHYILKFEMSDHSRGKSGSESRRAGVERRSEPL